MMRRSLHREADAQEMFVLPGFCDPGAEVRIQVAKHYFLARSTSVRLSESMVAVIPKRNSSQVKAEVRAIKKAGNEINKSVGAARHRLS
jgi:hypothetical protein